MLNKTLLILAIFSVVVTQHKVSDAQKKNIKRIAKNAKKMNKTQKKFIKHVNGMKSHFKKLRKFHNHIKKNGIHISHKRYNKLLQRYGKMVKSYNKNRKNVCAKLPPLWAFVNKKRNDYTPLEYKCKKYFYQGQKLGDNLAKFVHRINGFRSSGHKILKKLKCINGLVNKNKGSRNNKHVKRCYLKGYRSQMHGSLIGLKHKNRRNRLIIIRPFRNYRSKKRALKRAIRRLKKVKGKK